MKHVGSFSTGLSSAVMITRLIARYGREAVEIVTTDTLFEDDDNWRFSNAMRQFWGGTVTVLTEGHTPYQVAFDQHIIPNQKIAPCTFKLKIAPFLAYLERFEKPVTVHVGYDFAEAHRCAKTKAAYAVHGYEVDFPLLWKPIEFRTYSQVAREDWGIEPPRMYAMGYTHANCGGRCVKQGQGDWLRTLINFPERYAEIEAWEQEMRDHPKRKNYALVRDTVNGEMHPITLCDLRLEYEAGHAGNLLDLDAAHGCVVCGVGDYLSGPAEQPA